ncbi:MAG: ABC transporter [Candidatus Aminicenantes bacterium RBG_16_63_16]|nr:MAG: ABC transporter [Candidatus Aminicenantes bacterium RBG_16_63_16]
MRKFLNLLQKEIKELITLQLFISLLFTIFLFYFIGQMLKTEIKKAMRVQKIAVLNLDDSAFSQNLIRGLKSANFEPQAVPDQDTEKAVQWTKGTDINLLLVIPPGFGESIEKFENKEIETYSFLRTFSIVGSRSSVIINAVIRAMNEYLSNDYLKKKIPDISPEQLKNPIRSKDFVVVKDRMAEGAAEKIAGFVSSQSIFVPIILMMIIIYASQMVISAIAMEKQNKTLETLLTVPVSRTAIVTAKMVAAAVVGLISAVIYMIGYRYSMGNLMGDVSRAVSSGMGDVIQKLGLAMTTKGYIVLGISLFFAILVALALATILGVLAEDFRAAQSLIMPLIFLVMIPYFLSFFSDPKNLSLPMKIFLYAIPFSHPFLTTQNLLLENYRAVLFGILYMLAFFIVLIIIAARIFSTDRVLTMKLRFGKKKLVI